VASAQLVEEFNEALCAVAFDKANIQRQQNVVSCIGCRRSSSVRLGLQPLAVEVTRLCCVWPAGGGCAALVSPKIEQEWVERLTTSLTGESDVHGVAAMDAWHACTMI
jgi:hypothetical protein